MRKCNNCRYFAKTNRGICGLDEGVINPDYANRCPDFQPKKMRTPDSRYFDEPYYEQDDEDRE